MKNAISRVLITGGAGFIGSRLALRLIEEGYEVSVLDNLSEQIHGTEPEESYLFQSIKDKVHFIYGDVRNKSDWEKALEGQDAVVHLAAETGTGQSMYQIHRYTDVNIGGTALLLDQLANSEHHIQKVVVASSRAIYGEGRYYCDTHGEVYPDSRKEQDLLNGFFECRCPDCKARVELMSTPENARVGAQSIYGITKFNQEQMVLVTCNSLGIPAVAFRYQNVYGPGQSLSNPYTGILSVFSTQIKNHNPLNVYEDGMESRDFVFIDDVVEATFRGLMNNSANGQVYNVGSGKATSVLEIARQLVRLYQSNVNIRISGNFRLGDIRHNYADLSRIEEDLDFHPEYDFNRGIQEFVSWVNQQKVKQDQYARSILELKEKGLFKG